MKSNVINKIILIIGILPILSCTHESELKQECAVVIEKQFSPEFNGSGSGVGMSSGGDLVVTSNSVHKCEQFMLVFKCEHNTVFSIDKKQLYNDLNKGDSVIIYYKEILNYKNEIVDFNFINAIKK